MPTLYTPGPYPQHLTPDGRARTIAAFHVAQDDVDKLTTREMRIDVLRALTSDTAVRWWIKQRWLETSRTIGNLQMLRLTILGLQTCSNSLVGLAHVNTDASTVANKRRLMTLGGPGYTRNVFSDLPADGGDA